MQKKTLKFKNHLAELILAGKKDVTWRCFNDQNLTAGDTLILINSDTKEAFAESIIESVREKPYKDLDDEDLIGHEEFNSKEEMLQTYRGYYGDRMTLETPFQIIKFKLL